MTMGDDKCPDIKDLMKGYISFRRQKGNFEVPSAVEAQTDLILGMTFPERGLSAVCTVKLMELLDGNPGQFMFLYKDLGRVMDGEEHGRLAA